MRCVLIMTAILGVVAMARADGPRDNDPNNVRPVPPKGIVVPAKTRAELQAGVDELGKEIAELRESLAKKPALLTFLPDVQIYYNAVYYALKYDEFHAAGEFAVAKKHLQQGLERAKNLREGKTPWNTATGPVVRGYQSKIDGSVQPYGIIVPASFKAPSAVMHRLDLWWHGRGETLTELSFLNSRSNDKNQFTPNGFVLHPYGRYCNANRFAGEIDTFEAIAHARKHYPIDVNRIVARGYSMGGAACWGYTVHYPGLWAAAQPGAGFSETPEFLRVFQQEKISYNAWEKKLLHWYDCTDWAGNIYNVPTVAFSNEKEKQRQAADIMSQAMLKEGLHLTHILAPGEAHRYPPPPKERDELFGRIDSIVAKGRDPVPKRIRFTTYTLRYNSMQWATIDALIEHWERAELHARVLNEITVGVHTKNVTAFTLALPPGQRLLDHAFVQIETDGIDHDPVDVKVQSDRSCVCHLRLLHGKWKLVDKADDGTLAKRHGLQGPIDDAFMDTFVMVRQTAKRPVNEYAKLYTWIDKEMEHAVDHWRKQFRGELKVIDDADVDDKMIANSNLILWGDRHTNPIIAKIADKLPIHGEARPNGTDVVKFGGQALDATRFLPVLIYPNPLNPKKYVVLNSGFTFREYDYLNNARQIPRLPDWAILDINQPRTTQRPAGIVDAGFFDERWQLPGKK